MSDHSKRHMLRHFIAALSYRGSNVLGSVSDSVTGFHPSENVRSPVEILNHINGVLTYAHSFLVSYETTRLPQADWATEVRRFFDVLEHLDRSLAAGIPIREVSEEQLLQGPLADAMLHLGQIGIFRRMAGSPVEPENYIFADITVGQLRRPV